MVGVSGVLIEYSSFGGHGELGLVELIGVGEL